MVYFVITYGYRVVSIPNEFSVFHQILCIRVFLFSKERERERKVPTTRSLAPSEEIRCVDIFSYDSFLFLRMFEYSYTQLIPRLPAHTNRQQQETRFDCIIIAIKKSVYVSSSDLVTSKLWRQKKTNFCVCAVWSEKQTEWIWPERTSVSSVMVNCVMEYNDFRQAVWNHQCVNST